MIRYEIEKGLKRPLQSKTCRRYGIKYRQYRDYAAG
jgi:hypothetical protein